MIDFNTPLAGIQRAEASVNRTAAKLATAGDPQGDAVDLSAAAVALLSARTSVQANVNVIRAQDAIGQTLVNLLG
jgi:hypothetical protein